MILLGSIIYVLPFFIFADLVNVFEVFLPQLLLYPNPSDPLNGEAAALMMRDRTTYDQRVKGKNFHIVNLALVEDLTRMCLEYGMHFSCLSSIVICCLGCDAMV